MASSLRSQPTRSPYALPEVVPGRPGRPSPDRSRGPATGGRLNRAWRAVRRRDGGGRGAQRRCGASGWHLSAGCTEGGLTVCPLCGQRVAAVHAADVPSGVAVIQAHRA
ncbi:MAG TPA: hypothetical protein VFW63_13000 [Acidimicrobiales bacterium]|nr:hypothetical protein [Acidimicrobiales bacterium]